MSCLDDAYIDFDSRPDDKFLATLSSLSSLALYLKDEMVVGCSTIKFSRLMECIIYPEESDWIEPTLLLLGNSPKLKSLTIDYDCTPEPEDLPLSWNPPSSVPGCLSSELELFVWKFYGGREEEEQFLKYILANAKCLKTAVISLMRTTPDLEMMMEALKDIPRVSTESKLMFET
ncbi:hypothetical protein AALP_AA8G040000 [Arabis alpina]|uniref:FBD domain-containing protein n=1 Tax=Arabis alpina TaxID=50452 RepID=A0A087G4V1_ARAAL|nr:hypothetical protein AALP_AA8G040000 [Arabis alpina]